MKKLFHITLTWLFMILTVNPVLAQEGQASIDPMAIVSTIVYSVLGIALLLISYKAFDLITGYNFRNEIADDNNTAVGVMVGGLFVGVAVIIAASII